MSRIEVNINNISNNPMCPHGPSILFSRVDSKGGKENFFACSACRDRKDCQFYLEEDEKDKMNDKASWEKARKRFIGELNHRKLFLMLNEVRPLQKCVAVNNFSWLLFF